MITVTLPSVTYAEKAKKLLNRSGIPSKIIKVDAEKTRRGCTYGVTFNDNDYWNAVMTLRNNDVPYETYPYSEKKH